MIDINKYIDIVKKKLKDHPKRFQHILRVYEMAIELANHYNISTEQVGLAAIFHDYAKYDSIEEQTKYLSSNEIENYKDTPVIYHAFSAAKVLEHEYNIKDKIILNAIKYHVWGHKEMDIVTKIVLISDKIEKGRTYSKASYFRKLAFENLNLAIYEFLNDIIIYLEKNNFTIHNEQKEVILKLKEAINSEKN